MEESSSSSFVCVDELGRGTEAAHGTAIAAAVIEKLDYLGCRGVFATHLHGVLDCDTLSPFAKNMRMGTTTTPEGKMSPTWKLEDGECRESLAIQTRRLWARGRRFETCARAFLRRILILQKTALVLGKETCHPPLLLYPSSKLRKTETAVFPT